MVLVFTVNLMDDNDLELLLCRKSKCLIMTIRVGHINNYYRQRK